MHWSIESGLHWVLDVSFDEDGSRLRTANLGENFATTRRAEFNLLKTAPSPKKGSSKINIIQLRRFCIMSPDYHELVLRLLGPDTS